MFPESLLKEFILKCDLGELRRKTTVSFHSAGNSEHEQFFSLSIMTWCGQQGHCSSCWLIITDGPANRGILSTKERALGLRGNPGKKAKVLAMERLRTEAGRQTQEWQDAPWQLGRHSELLWSNVSYQRHPVSALGHWGHGSSCWERVSFLSLYAKELLFSD